jgi:alpha-tubulin suppressor-like RCC1 family protein
MRHANHFVAVNLRAVAMMVVAFTLLNAFIWAAEEPDVLDIGAGQMYSLAVCEGGAVLGSGGNWLGQLGDGTTMDSEVPVEAIGPKGGSRLVTSKSGHTLAVNRNGDVWAWGNNGLGQLGFGQPGWYETAPGQVPGLGEVIAVAAGHDHSLALRADGTVWAWGGNWIGQLGEPSAGGWTLNPVRVTALSNVVAIAAGWYHSLALTEDGTLWAWGANVLGQLGIGQTSWGEWAPVAVLDLPDVVSIGTGVSHSLAVTGDGSLWAWGANLSGQLGDGTRTNRNAPVRVVGLSGGTAVAGGEHHSISLLTDGTVWTWGRNAQGQLGDGSTEDSNVPVQVGGLQNIVAVAAGSWHSMALDQRSLVWTWGQNRGALGNGRTDNTNAPVKSLFGKACRVEN